MGCTSLTTTATFEGPFTDVVALRALLREFSTLYDDLKANRLPDGAILGQATSERLRVNCVRKGRVKELARRVAELRVDRRAA
jgi:hypothetical protein